MYSRGAFAVASGCGVAIASSLKSFHVQESKHLEFALTAIAASGLCCRTVGGVCTFEGCGWEVVPLPPGKCARGFGASRICKADRNALVRLLLSPNSKC